MTDFKQLFKHIVDDLFTHSSPWAFTSSAGGSLGASVFGASGGVLYVKNGESRQERKLMYGVAGAGYSPSPVGGSFSTPNMWSTGLGKIRARAPEPLTFDKMTGPMCIVSGTLVSVSATPTPGQGASSSIYFLGIPVLPALSSFPFPFVLNWVATGAINASAIGMMVGKVKGADVGISVEIGYGR